MRYLTVKYVLQHYAWGPIQLQVGFDVVAGVCQVFIVCRTQRWDRSILEESFIFEKIYDSPEGHLAADRRSKGFILYKVIIC